jgi:lysine 6-dehydrogenase
MRAIILGAGLVGGPMAIDLARDEENEITVVDIDALALRRLRARAPVKTVVGDLADQAFLQKTVQAFDYAISAVPGFMGFTTLRNLIEAGCENIVDIAFFSEDPFTLDTLARRHGARVIVDSGVAPGMSNLLAGYVYQQLDKTESLEILVGGLPIVRQWPYAYKAVFSPIDVIAEYTRPARLVENGQIVVKEALSETELVDFPGLGTLEAFNSDGLRTLATTLKIPDMKEKTLRYPGHSEIMRVLRETGFFATEEVEVNGHKVRPLDVTAKVLFPTWKMEKGEGDMTIMRIIISGRKGGKRLKYQYDLRDAYDPHTGTTSMARTTGYSATMALRLLASGKVRQNGIIAPEFLGQESANVAFLRDGLKERGVAYVETITEIENE